jgi:hypothetical protein
MKTYALLLLSFVVGYSFGQELAYADKIRIKEAVNISDKYGDKLFKNYSKVPFAMLLVTDSTEFLINHPNPSNEFKFAGYDSILKSNVYFRKTQFDTHLLATFPAVKGLSCIVVGTPENTNTNSTYWMITLLHEHFHQYQASDPNYYESVNNLDLSGGEMTGTWMLNYPFPYTDPAITKQFELYTSALSEAVSNSNEQLEKQTVSNYFDQREKLKQLLSEKDYRYFSLQIWQEGLARNTEYEFLKMLKDYQPSDEVTKLDDFVPFAEQLDIMYELELKNVTEQKIEKAKRVTFYSIGFAEGLLLDKLNANWREKYLVEKFYIERYWKN